jgi:hypothetical protein
MQISLKSFTPLFVFILFGIHFCFAQSEITTEKLILTDGASSNYILKSDGQGNATWADPTSFLGNGFSNWTISGNNLYNNNSNFVGVGTSDPKAKFMIVGGGDVNLTSNPSFQIGIKEAENLAIDNNEILARNNGAQVIF